MAKKILAILFATIMIGTLALSSFAYGAWDEVENGFYKLNFEGAIQSNSTRLTGGAGPCFSGSQSMWIDPHSAALAGGRDIQFQYFDSDVNMDDDNRILPAGDYTVTFWVLDEFGYLGEDEIDGDMMLTLTLFTPDQDAALYSTSGGNVGYSDPEKNVAFYTIFDFTGKEVNATKINSAENEYGTWDQYSFDMNVPEDCDKASFMLDQFGACTTHYGCKFYIDEVVFASKNAAETTAPAESETTAPAESETTAPAESETTAPAESETETAAPAESETTATPAEDVAAPQTFDMNVVFVGAAILALAAIVLVSAKKVRN